MSYAISGKHVIGQFGGVAALRDTAKRHGVPLSQSQVRKWAERDTISSDGLAALVVLADAAQLKLDLKAAIVPAEGASW
jgi:hypothetical protein